MDLHSDESIRKKKSNPKKMQDVSKHEIQKFLNFSFKEHIFDDYVYRPHSKTNYNYRKHYYLRAKFKFIVDHEVLPDTTNFTPEKPLEWEKIEQVIFATAHEVMCPICLNEGNQIIAPQITTCGHIFCWPCFLRHVETSKTKKKCPLCGEIAFKEDLKIVKVNLFPIFSERDIIQFTLLIRNKSNNIIYDPENGIENIDFSRIIQVNKEYIRTVIMQEKKELDEFLQLCNSSQEYDYINSIEEAFKLSDFKLSVLEKNSEKSSEKNSEKNARNGKNSDELNEKRHFLYSKYDNYVRKYIDKNECIKHPDQFHFIYQESDGQLMFLHPINYKYLMIEYESTDNLPIKIEGKITNIDQISLTDKFMQRYKFLNHLPENTDAKFVEINMDNLLNRENLHKYQYEMNEFRKKLREKEEALNALQENQNKKHNKYYSKKHAISEETPIYNMIQKSFSVNINPSEQKNDIEEYPELPKIESLQQEIFSTEQEQSLAENLQKAEEKKLESELQNAIERKENENKKEERPEDKQYFLSDYIFGETSINLESVNKKTSNNKKNKKNKKIILFSNSLNHY